MSTSANIRLWRCKQELANLKRDQTNHPPQTIAIAILAKRTTALHQEVEYKVQFQDGRISWERLKSLDYGPTIDLIEGFERRRDAARAAASTSASTSAGAAEPGSSAVLSTHSTDAAFDKRPAFRFNLSRPTSPSSSSGSESESGSYSGSESSTASTASSLKRRRVAAPPSRSSESDGNDSDTSGWRLQIIKSMSANTFGLEQKHAKTGTKSQTKIKAGTASQTKIKAGTAKETKLSKKKSKRHYKINLPEVCAISMEHSWRGAHLESTQLTILMIDSTSPVPRPSIHFQWVRSCFPNLKGACDTPINELLDVLPGNDGDKWILPFSPIVPPVEGEKQKPTFSLSFQSELTANRYKFVKEKKGRGRFHKHFLWDLFHYERDHCAPPTGQQRASAASVSRSSAVGAGHGSSAAPSSDERGVSTLPSPSSLSARPGGSPALSRSRTPTSRRSSSSGSSSTASSSERRSSPTPPPRDDDDATAVRTDPPSRDVSSPPRLHQWFLAAPAFERRSGRGRNDQN
ncbi:hypothetical protein BDK51DRAFT_26823 [Blyttiomyces helicus]|uniref:Chromo domain-containing protein n=1 Tax=Blyttiomyces helicus TaxID=388810 RepID=A0A4P9WN28_9FUNG|nr:hypothetical protein BDK51DRAFT_26823 [Blyttiomyces helicus]|eukprot:RKO92156.1 hypothetical protein BDK51DRAFT_26823 [Blyttiomyces helicus]